MQLKNVCHTSTHTYLKKKELTKKETTFKNIANTKIQIFDLILYFKFPKHYSMPIFSLRGENVSIVVRFQPHYGEGITRDTIYAMPAACIIK